MSKKDDRRKWIDDINQKTEMHVNQYQQFHKLIAEAARNKNLNEINRLLQEYEELLDKVDKENSEAFESLFRKCRTRKIVTQKWYKEIFLYYF